MVMIRTSISHPIKLDFVSIAPGYGRVGMTFCPGKCQLSGMSRAWRRDLALDLDAIAAHGVAVVVSLVEQHEFDSLGVTDLGAAVHRRHMAWLHLPIGDVSIPDTAFERAWVIHGESLRARLRDGFDILVHCKGGLGRAGTIAAKLLVELGTVPDAAIQAVRSARHGAIETRRQESYVRAQRPVAEPLRCSSQSAIDDRATGSLIGLAVGDAIGTTLEFSRRDVKPLLTDMIGGGPFGLRPGEWTDDTAMALALADSLAHDAALDATDLMHRFTDWYARGTYSCTGRCFDIGITTRTALARYRSTGDPIAGATDPATAGNGSLMRLAPVALCHHRDRATLARVAEQQSITTHAAPEAIAACVSYANILADAIDGRPRSQVMRARIWPGAGAITSIVAGSWRGKKRDAIRSSGYVAHSLEAALWAVGRSADFPSAVLIAANLGDDADTTAAIAGQLAGALYGLSNIPTAWLDRLAWKDRLITAANALASR